MAELDKVIVGIEHCDKLGCSMCPYKPGGYSPMDCRIQLMRDALELLKEYRQHLKKDLETLKEEKRRLEFEHEAKAFIYKENEGLTTIKINS